MANCCDYSLCEGLATIDFMRSLIPNEMNSCIEVSAGTIVSTCCGNVSESNYVPKYSEITGHTFAPLRVTASTPSNDVNGFTYVTPTLVPTDCCTGDTLENESLMKSQLGFEYTSAVTCSHIELTEPTYCDLNYKLTVNKEWDRHRYECDENSSGNISHTINSVTDSAETRSGTLISGVTEVTEGGSDNIHEYKFSFKSVTVTSETTAHCSETKTASTTFSLDDYTVSFSLNCPDSKVPCSGGTYKNVVVIEESGKCDGDIVLGVKYYIDSLDEPTSAFTLSNLSDNTLSGDMEVPLNDVSLSGGVISVDVSIGNSAITETFSCEFERELCGWSPTYSKTKTCSVLSIDDWSWNHPDRKEHQHDY